MIPIRDNIPSRRTAWVLRLLFLANIVVFALELRQGPAIEGFLYQYGVVPSHWLVSDAADLAQWPRLFVTLLSSQFLHGGFLHLGSNLLYLWIFGDNVEDRLGHARFLLLYLGSGIIAALTQILATPGSAVPMVGASGAIAGVLGAYLLLFPAARIVTLIPTLGLLLETVELPAFFVLGLWFLLQWIQGMTAIGEVADVGGIAFWAHMGGFISGMIGVVLLRPSRR